MLFGQGLGSSRMLCDVVTSKMWVVQDCRTCSVYLLYSPLIHTLLTNELDLQWPLQGVVGGRILDL